MLISGSMHLPNLDVMADQYARAGCYQEALATYRKLYRLAESRRRGLDHAYCLEVAKMYRMLSRFRLSCRYVQKALKLQPACTETLFWSAIIFAESSWYLAESDLASLAIDFGCRVTGLRLCNVANGRCRVLSACLREYKCDTLFALGLAYLKEGDWRASHASFEAYIHARKRTRFSLYRVRDARSNIEAARHYMANHAIRSDLIGQKCRRA